MYQLITRDRVKAWQLCIAYRKPTTWPFRTGFFASGSTHAALSYGTRDSVTTLKPVKIDLHREHTDAHQRASNALPLAVRQVLTRSLCAFLQSTLLTEPSLTVPGTYVLKHYSYEYALISGSPAGGFSMERPPRCRRRAYSQTGRQRISPQLGPQADVTSQLANAQVERPSIPVAPLAVLVTESNTMNFLRLLDTTYVGIR